MTIEARDFPGADPRDPEVVLAVQALERFGAVSANAIRNIPFGRLPWIGGKQVHRPTYERLQKAFDQSPRDDAVTPAAKPPTVPTQHGKASRKRKFAEIDATAAARELVAGKKAEGTKRVYKTGQSHFREYLEQKRIKVADASEKDVKDFGASLAKTDPRSKTIPNRMAAARSLINAKDPSYKEVSKASRSSEEPLQAAPLTPTHWKQLVEQASDDGEVIAVVIVAVTFLLILRVCSVIGNPKDGIAPMQAAGIRFAELQGRGRVVRLKIPPVKRQDARPLELEELRSPVSAKTKTGVTLKLCPYFCLKFLCDRAKITGSAEVAPTFNYQRLHKTLDSLVRRAGLTSAFEDRKFTTHTGKVGGACCLCFSGLQLSVLKSFGGWKTWDEPQRYSRAVCLAPSCSERYKFYNPIAHACSYGAGLQEAAPAGGGGPAPM